MGSLRILRGAPRARLHVEQLESRLVPSGVQPTPTAQLMLEQLNDIRANPAAYGQSIGLDLSTVAPSQPLAWDPELIAAALGHSQDMNTNNYFGHTDSSGLNPGQRISAQGYNYSSWAESIAAGYSTTANALAGLIIDTGVPDLGHRLQLLSIGSSYQQTQVGIGVVMNGAGQYSDYYTIDDATPQSGGVFLTGAVFNDLNGNGKYDVGEGLGGVTINVQGGGSTTSFTSGGYTLQVAPGTYTVTASGGGLPAPITHTVTVGSQNVRLQFIESSGGTGGSTGGSTGGGTSGGTGGATGGASSTQHAADVAFVTQLYATDLKRAASATEVNTYSTYLDDGQTTQAALTNMVKSSQEYRNVCTVFLDQAYSDMLGRGIGSGELNSWLQYLQGAGTPGVAANAIANSLECHQRQWAASVQTVYQTYLHRSAGPNEVAAWVAQFGAGLTENNLIVVVMGSGEFKANVGTSNSQFVGALYQDILGRTASTQEIAGWAAILNNGYSRSAVVAGFLGSAEYVLQQYALWSTQLYSSLLGRTPGTSELASLVNALNTGTSYLALEDMVLTSQEYYNRAASIAS